MEEPISIIRYVVYVAYILTIVGTILIIVLGNRNPTKTAAWVLILVFVPVAGIILYYFFGQDSRKTKRKQLLEYEDFFNELFSDVSRNDFSQRVSENRDKVAYEQQNLVKLLENSNDSFVMCGSDVEIMTSGKRKFDALMEDIKNAKHHIHMEYFYFKKDRTGRKVKKLLMQKASEGIEVRFIYENVANLWIFPRYYYEMRKSGVMVQPFSKRSLPWVRRQLNYRNHRKVVVIDGNIGYMGGMNIGNRYADDPNWRDTHLRIVGSGVYGMQSNFLYDWYSSGGVRIKDYKKYFPVSEKYSENLMQVVPDSPDCRWGFTLMAMTQIISDAEKYIYIQTPYFIPADSLYQAMQAAALGGVDVRLMISKKSDTPLLDPAIQSYYDGLLRAGVKIHEMQDVFIHAKTMVVDDYISVIGSTNMDFRSFEQSFEINCYMYDPKIAEQNKNIFFEDTKKCKELTLEEWVNRAWWRKGFESIMRLFAPLL